MRMYVATGKGGVGKTTTGVSLGLHLASQEKRVAIIDYDGGHSVALTLRLEETVIPNEIHVVSPYLSIVIVDPFKYHTAQQAKAAHWTLEAYLEQFKGYFGLLAWSDMLYDFFGLPIDVPGQQKFITLVHTLLQLEEQGYEHVIFDVEPTAGFERFLSRSDDIIKGLDNLKDNTVILTAIGLKWPDVKGYLKGDYVQNQLDTAAANMQHAIGKILSGAFFIVSNPRTSPAQQTFQIQTIIEKVGGKTVAIIVNNIQNRPYEKKAFVLLGKHGRPIIPVPEQERLEDSDTNPIPFLQQIGATIFTHCTL